MPVTRSQLTPKVKSVKSVKPQRAAAIKAKELIKRCVQIDCTPPEDMHPQ